MALSPRVTLLHTMSNSTIAESVVVGHYQLRERLGEGGFGEVFAAWDNKLQRRVAIKRLKRMSGSDDTDGLMEEARLAASLQHAAFVKVHAIEDDDHSQSIVMELVPGETLRTLVGKQAIDEAKALDIARQVADAMREAHDAGLVHGDLKPSNLMLEPSGKVRILDFGLASKRDADATASVSQSDPQGTIAYMAPERLLGGPLTAQSDVYALGTILFELCTGARPYPALGGLALAAALMQSSSAQWSYPENMRPALVKLIRAMTAREPAERLGTMSDVAAQIAALVSPSAASASATTSTWRKRWVGTTTTQRRTFAVVMVMSILLVGIWQVAPLWPTLRATLTPFSASVAMKDGLDALKLFDRPGSLDVAAKNFSAILEREHESAAATAGLTLVYINRYMSDKQDDSWLKQAEAGAQQALKLNDQLALAHVANGWVLAQQGKLEAALSAQERALNLDPENFFAWFGKGQVLRQMRRYADARQTDDEAIRRFPQERVFADELGTVFYEQGDYAAAEKAFRRSIELQPDAVHGYANLKAALSRQGREDEGLQVLQQGLQVRPNAKLYGNLGNALFQRGDYVGAVAAFEHAVSPTKGNPQQYLNWANLADALMWIPGRETDARQAYEKARALLAVRLERTPNDPTLVSRMGLYAARVKAPAEARALIQRALQTAPDNADVHFRGGLAYELIGDRDAALEALLRARKLGYPEKYLTAEPALVGLRRDPRFARP